MIPVQFIYLTLADRMQGGVNELNMALFKYFIAKIQDWSDTKS